MQTIIDNPFIIFVFFFGTQWCAAYLGNFFRVFVKVVWVDYRH